MPEGAYGKALAAGEEIEALYAGNLANALARGQIADGSNVSGLGKMLQTLDQGLHIQGLAGATDAQKDRVISAVMAGLRV
ncbi:hypothetical protein D3C72_2418430 [compost metagenome]